MFYKVDLQQIFTWCYFESSLRAVKLLSQAISIWGRTAKLRSVLHKSPIDSCVTEFWNFKELRTLQALDTVIQKYSEMYRSLISFQCRVTCCLSVYFSMISVCSLCRSSPFSCLNLVVLHNLKWTAQLYCFRFVIISVLYIFCFMHITVLLSMLRIFRVPFLMMFPYFVSGTYLSCVTIILLRFQFLLPVLTGVFQTSFCASSTLKSKSYCKEK